jgi:hypothetical protein
VVLAAVGCGRGDPSPPPPSPAAGQLPPGHPPVGAAPESEAGPSISGRVTLDPALATRSGVALYIIARHAASQQIVAVRKQEAPRFPLQFSISAADAMTGGTSFEGPLDLTARLSQGGDAIPARGDVEGGAKGVLPGANDVTIVLDSVRQ